MDNTQDKTVNSETVEMNLKNEKYSEGEKVRIAHLCDVAALLGVDIPSPKIALIFKKSAEMQKELGV